MQEMTFSSAWMDTRSLTTIITTGCTVSRKKRRDAAKLLILGMATLPNQSCYFILQRKLGIKMKTDKVQKQIAHNCLRCQQKQIPVSLFWRTVCSDYGM